NCRLSSCSNVLPEYNLGLRSWLRRKACPFQKSWRESGEPTFSGAVISALRHPGNTYQITDAGKTRRGSGVSAGRGLGPFSLLLGSVFLLPDSRVRRAAP